MNTAAEFESPTAAIAPLLRIATAIDALLRSCLTSLSADPIMSERVVDPFGVVPRMLRTDGDMFIETTGASEAPFVADTVAIVTTALSGSRPITTLDCTFPPFDLSVSVCERNIRLHISSSPNPFAVTCAERSIDNRRSVAGLHPARLARFTHVTQCTR